MDYSLNAPARQIVIAAHSDVPKHSEIGGCIVRHHFGETCRVQTVHDICLMMTVLRQPEIGAHPLIDTQAEQRNVAMRRSSLGVPGSHRDAYHVRLHLGAGLCPKSGVRLLAIQVECEVTTRFDNLM